MSATSNPDAPDLTDIADALCRALGYADRSTFYDRHRPFDQSDNRHVVSTAFRVVGVHAVFGIAEGASPGSFKPTVYVGCAATDNEADGLHRRTWTQGAVPLLLVVRQGSVEIRDAFSPPGGERAGGPYSPNLDLDPAFARVTATALTNSLHWRDLPISRASAIDARLVTAIDDLNRVARDRYPGLGDRRGLVNALIGRLIYLYVLIDRGIVGREWMERTIKAAGCRTAGFAGDASRRGVRAVETEFGVDEVWAVLRGVDRLVNGSVFPITRRERAEMPAGLIRTMHRVLRCADVETVAGRQVSFLDVSFEVLRTETISAIYEHFVRSEGADLQRSSGAFYTPPYLADFVLAEVERVRPLDVDARVLDCTAGSGVFLVSAYRRIMESATPSGGWSPTHARAARDILTGCIHGIERNRQAANVCRFSLYLTMLDYVGQDGIEELAERFPRRPGEKLFPRLRRHVVTGDAFDTDRLERGSFTHVVGNPPWSQKGRRRYDRNRGAAPVKRDVVPDLARETFEATLLPHEETAHGRSSDLFTWAALRYLAPGGALGLVLPTASLVGRQSGNFGTALAAAVSVRFVANLSFLRYHLFSGAKAAASVVVARKSIPDALDPVGVYRPRMPSLPLGKSKDVWSLLVSQTDLHTVRSRDLLGGHNGWFSATMLGPYDRRLREALGTWSEQGDRTFGGFLRRSDLLIRRGGSPAETGLPAPERRTPRRKGSKEPVLRPLDEASFAMLPPEYRNLFSAGAVLVPRTLRGFRLLDEPYAFSSTYNAIVPASPRPADGRSDEWRLASATVKGRRREGLLGMIRFLESGVMGYFASIYGATTLTEDARFEQGDLNVVACPFTDLDDPRLRALSHARDVDAVVLDAMNAGTDLRAAVEEFVAFNEGYLDGQSPGTAFEPARADEVERYVSRFERELGGQFGGNGAPMVRQGRPDAGFVRLDVIFLGSDRVPAAPAARWDGRFVAASVIDFDPATRRGEVVKTRARFAWTSDQAVADADAMARIVGRSKRT